VKNQPAKQGHGEKRTTGATRKGDGNRVRVNDGGGGDHFVWDHARAKNYSSINQKKKKGEEKRGQNQSMGVEKEQHRKEKKYERGRLGNSVLV